MKKIWTKQKCAEEALKYNTKVQFQKNSQSAYQIASRNGWINEICTHMVALKKTWDKESVFLEASKYQYGRQFQLKASGAYKAADRLGILKEILLKMPGYDCSKRRMPLNLAKLKLGHRLGTEFDIDEKTYVSFNKKCRFIDKNHGEWWTTPRSVAGGSSHPARTKEKIVNTNLKKYGKIHTCFVKEISDKRKATILKKYGVDNVSKNEKIKEKKRQTVLKNYKVEYPAQNKDIQLKIRKTNLKKYGFVSPSQNSEIALRQAKKVNNCYIKYHWKTNEEIVCIGSYEAKTVDYLNHSKINYEWQPKVFITPIKTNKGSNTTYRPDLYLTDQDLWVEIKGYMRKDALEKWEWFKSIMPNSELWDKQKLLQLKII